MNRCPNCDSSRIMKTVGEEGGYTVRRYECLDCGLIREETVRIIDTLPEKPYNNTSIQALNFGRR